jgi:hypothetical protein
MTPARQLVEQSLGFLQIARDEPLSEPPKSRDLRESWFSASANDEPP